MTIRVDIILHLFDLLLPSARDCQGEPARYIGTVGLGLRARKTLEGGGYPVILVLQTGVEIKG